MMKHTGIRVLHLNDVTGWRGGERQTLLLVKGLQEHGHYPLLGVPPESILSRRAKEENIPTVPIGMRGEYDIFSVFKIRRILRMFSIDMMHAHTAHAHTMGLLALHSKKRPKFVVSRRINFPIRKNIFSRMKYFSPRIDRFITISRAISDILVNDGIDSEKISLVYSGIDLNKYQPSKLLKNVKRELKIPKNAIVAGCVAALTPCKAHEILIQAASIACKKDDRLFFLLIGDGECEHRLKAMVSQRSLNHRIIFTGFRTDIGDLMHITDIFVISSKTEGLGTAILDAMAMGLPIVATCAGGIPEIVTNNYNGLLSSVGNYDALAENLLRMSSDQSFRKKCGKNSKLAAEKFSITKTVQSTISIYEELLHNK